ncbi:MAG: hypothetical protein KAV42_05235 [Candidatus Krumholzibacteria bacterium]|nr:hypothetical protein [Candidatus Krumholzibacteria bacterium]
MKKQILLMIPVLVILLIVWSGSCQAEELMAEGLLPGSGQLEGWVRDGDMIEYFPDNLWEYINGSAENFLMYDFRQVVAMHYLDPSEREIKVEIYDHGGPLMTFGIYSMLRSPDAEYLAIGCEAFGDEYTLHFWKDRFYVKVYSYSEGPGMREAMKAFAGEIEKTITGTGGEPSETDLFPEEDLVKKSITYMTKGVMSSSKLPPAFVARYEKDSVKGKVYLFASRDADESAELIASYAKMIGAGVEKVELSGVSCLMVDGEAPYRGRVVAVQSGSWMAVVTGFDGDPASADTMAGRLVARMKPKQ